MVLQRAMSIRSRVRAWCFYTALGYVAVTVTVVGLTQQDLASVMGLSDVLELHPIFLGRFFGALVGTLLGGVLCDWFPIKQLMAVCVVLSAASIAFVPHAAGIGLPALLVNFACIGVAGAALVCCATTAACWAFSGENVGPILSGCAASFGLSSAALPLLLEPVSGKPDAEYLVASACAIPTLVLLAACETPVRPAKLGGQASGSSNATTSKSTRCAQAWALAACAGVAQVLLQGANAAMLMYMVTFGQQQLGLPRHVASLLLTLLQGGVMVGSLLAAQFQKQFALLNLACIQLALVTLTVAVWMVNIDLAVLAFVAVVLYGLLGGPTLGYSNALFNKYTTPSGAQMSLINLGSNCGTGIAPFVAGSLMQHRGPFALLWMVLAANATVLVGMLLLWLLVRSTSTAAREVPASLQDRHGSPLLDEA
eukprot:TRINITY_DN19253_c0_g1_i1.p1 TRINITY_DN19253_c0_g1~~TRINITY_DN19253_c0_g1_i1.p1  ORF type:complete len:425 (-),score=76.80 TRINITY_DN19253_c0_g1_i1:120-1394(-)